jgi:exopolysaccharide production protein ExoQ
VFKLSEKAFAIAMLFYTTGAVFPFLAGDQNRYSPLQGNMFNLGLQLIFYTGAFWFMAHHWKTVIYGAKHAKWIVALLLIAIASTAWSQDPLFTLRRCLVLLATTAFGVYFGSRFTVPQQLRLLAWTCALVVGFSFAIAILMPRYGVDHFLHPGDWQGAFTQKNMLARIMVLAVLVFYFAKQSLGPWVRWAGIAAAFALLVLSRSVTGAIVFTAICVTVPLYRLLRTKITFAIPVVVAIAVATVGSAVAVASSLTDILQLVNRSPRLTGRTDLWGAVVTAILKHPWLGYGFNGFWQGLQGESASVLLTVGWPALHSHNGFLDLTLDLGLLGLLVFAIGYCSLLRRALSLVAHARGDVPIWLCTYLAFMFLYNLSESSILVDNNICWILYISTAVSLSMCVQAKQTRTEVATNHGR